MGYLLNGDKLVIVFVWNREFLSLLYVYEIDKGIAAAIAKKGIQLTNKLKERRYERWNFGK